MRASLVVLMMGLLLMPGIPARAASVAEEKLPTDPALVTGTLPNGLSYIIRKHRNPEGRVSIWLHVSSGSLNETDATQGLAHFLEHMAFNGSANFPAGTVIPFFQSLGLAFGRDQNAFTSFDQTTYQLALPGGGRDVLDKGMLFMSDVAMRLSLQTAEIDSERQIILEEKRARSSAQQRVQDQIFEKLAPETARDGRADRHLGVGPPAERGAGPGPGLLSLGGCVDRRVAGDHAHDHRGGGRPARNVASHAERHRHRPPARPASRLHRARGAGRAHRAHRGCRGGRAAGGDAARARSAAPAQRRCHPWEPDDVRGSEAPPGPAPAS